VPSRLMMSPSRDDKYLRKKVTIDFESRDHDDLTIGHHRDHGLCEK
jgi:hypothetical protein